MPAAFHAKLKRLREKAGLNQKQFAHFLGCAPSKVSTWERGLFTPWPHTQCAIFEQLKEFSSGLRVRKGRAWPAALLRLLGNMPDHALAQKFNVSERAVRKRRMQEGIPLFVSRRWTQAETRLLGTMSDTTLARKLGKSKNSVCLKRTRLNIPSVTPQPTLYRWTPAQLRRLGTIADKALASELSISCYIVRAMRARLGITAFRFAKSDPVKDTLR